MAYSITTKDGITVQNIPDNVAPDAPELKAKVAEIRSTRTNVPQGTVATGPDGQPYAAQQVGDTLEITQLAPRQVGSVGYRLAHGITEPVAGLGQLASRPLAAAGGAIERVAGPNALSTYLQELPARNDAVVRDLQAEQERIAPEGVDAARLAGNLVTLAPTVAAGGIPATTAGLARVGAVTGAVGGAAAPVTGDDFGASKTGQVAAGAAIGGAGGPLAAKAASLIGNSMGRIVGAVRQNFGASASPQNIEIVINQALQGSGIDPNQLSAAFRAQIRDDVGRALATGGQVDERAIANRAAFDVVGAQPTRGQITQNPTQFGDEMFLRQTRGGEDLAANYTDTLGRLNQTLGDIQARGPQPVRDYQAGQRAVDSLLSIDQPRKGAVNAAYTKAKTSLGVDSPLDGKALHDSLADALDAELRTFDDLPAPVRTFIAKAADGVEPFRIADAERMIQQINRARKGMASNDARLVPLNIAKRQIEDSIEAAGDAAGGETAKLFGEAKALARKRFETIDSVPALKEALRDKITPDQFMQKFVYNSNNRDFRALRAYIQRNDPATWGQIKAQVLQDIRAAANRGSDAPDSFSGAAFRKEIRALEESGKLERLFTKAEISQLKAIDRVAHLVQTGPAGVSRTGMGGAAKAASLLLGMVERLGGPIGGLVKHAATTGQNQVRATVARTAAPMASTGQLVAPTTANALGRLAAPLALPALE